jgi:predicted RNA-binding protein associated with RNAse of E/G family
MEDDYVLSTKVMSRSHWPRVIDKDYTYMLIDDQYYRGAVGLIRINEIDKPATILYDSIPVKIIDKGYYWLQIGPEDQNYWITIMYNELEEIVQYYIDITDTNTILDNGESWFYDLMLDIVVLPDGRRFLLDEDELEQALNDNVITRELYDKAYLTANKIMDELDGKVDHLKAVYNTYFQTLKMRFS